MKKLLYLSIATLFLIACSKDQKAVKNLEGSWTRTAYKEAGVTIADTAVTTYKFTSCKVKKGDCLGELSSGGKTLPFTYNFTEKGEKFTMIFSLLGVTGAQEGDVVEQTSDEFIFNYTDDSGVLVEETLSK
mgnify:CR=1 FL=1